MISIHAPRAGGDKDKAYDNATTAEISIHAPRAGGDDAFTIVNDKQNDISIHAPRAGGDEPQGQHRRQGYRHFNPRPPCGGRP